MTLNVRSIEKVQTRPNPNEFEDKASFMEACMPRMIDEGKDQDQAVAACSNMWENRMATRAPHIRGQGQVREAVKGSRVVSFRSSTPDLDRHGTRILPRGIRTENYDRNPIFLWGHDGYGSLMGSPAIESIIGRTVRHTAGEEGFDHDVEFAPASVNPKGEMALRMVRAGFLNSTSIGFEPRQWHEEKRSAPEVGPPILIFDEVDLLEVSLVPIPSNPNAQALARTLAGQLAGPGFDQFLRGLSDDDLAGRVETWVRSAFEDEQSSPPEVRPTPDEQSSPAVPEDEQSSPLVDLVRHLAIRPWEPAVGSQVIRALNFGRVR